MNHLIKGVLVDLGYRIVSSWLFRKSKFEIKKSLEKVTGLHHKSFSHI